ncbi:MAG: MaoC family dehydratase N-terminal domain-containing protein [Gammaproteobacteria bacterium]
MGAAGALGRDIVGYRTPRFEVAVEKGRLRLFAKAIGQTDPVYTDEAAAREAGYRSLPVPPTFFFCLEMERADPYDWFAALEIPLPRVLHGEQSFTYHRTACAGDVLSFSGEVVDVYAKKGGALEFLVHRNFVATPAGDAVAEFDRTLVIRRG